MISTPSSLASSQLVSASPTLSVPSRTSQLCTASPQSRFYILDLVRLVAMVLMMQGHTLDALVAPQHLSIADFPWNIWHFMRGLTAPIFLMISGAVQVFANKRDESGSIGFNRYWKQVRWAITLMGIGYLLVFPANRLRDLPFVSAEGWKFFFQVNILQLSGLMLIGVMTVMFFTKSTKSFARITFAIGAALMMLSPFAYTINWFSFLPEVVAAYLSFAHGSLFCVFPFAAYMFFGVSIGTFLAKIPTDQREMLFPRYALRYGFIAVVLGLVGTYAPVSFYPTHDYYLASPNFVLIRMGCTLLLMGGLTYVYRFTKRFEEYYSRLGKKSLYIYTTHLVLLFGTPWFGGIARNHYRALDLPTGMAIAIAVVAGTLLTAYMLDFHQRNSLSIRRGLHVSLTAMLLYALLV